MRYLIQMSIDFDRSRLQVEYEQIIGISSIEQLTLQKDVFKNHILTNDDVFVLSEALKNDALDYFYNGILTFAEGIDSIYENRFSWATVKLYYSIFYLIKASMASKNIGLLRNKSMFRLKLRVGEKVYNTNNKKYNTTHEGTISHYKDLFSTSDKLLTNNIENQDAYAWMQNMREIVNYRQVAFKDPGYLPIWDKFFEASQEGTLNTLLQTLQDDDPYTYCFQEEFAIVGIPVKRLIQTIEDFGNADLLRLITTERKEYTKEIFHYNQRGLNIVSNVM